MGVTPILLFILLTREINAYTVTQVEEVKGKTIRQVKFDGEGNTYALGCTMDWSSEPQCKDYQLYRKFKNPGVSSSTIINLPNLIVDMLVSSRGDAYFRFQDGPNTNLSIIRANSTEFKVIDEISPSNLFYLDNNDNLFYGKGNDVYVLRPGPYAAVRVPNLEGSITGPISDTSGNVYFPMKNKKNCSLALITKGILQQENPQATCIDVLDNSKQSLHDLILDEKNNVWVTISDLESNEGVIKKLENGTLKTVFTDKQRSYHDLVRSPEKIYVIAKESDCKSGSIYYITPGDEVIEIPELKTSSKLCWLGVVDSKGQTYFLQKGRVGEFMLPKFASIQPNETKPVIFDKFRLRERTLIIKSAKVDFKDDLWIITAFYIHHLKKGEVTPVRLDDVDEICTPVIDVYFNPISRKVFVSCNKGLVILENI